MTQQILSGTFTVVSAKTGDHRTIRIQDDDFAWWTMGSKPINGTRVVKAMTGSDNESSFSYMGLLSPTGAFSPSKKFTDRVDFVAAVKYLLAKGVGNEVEYGKNYAVRSGKCFRCARKLTTPASVFYGYGPDCAQQMGLPYDTSAGTTKGSSNAAQSPVYASPEVVAQMLDDSDTLDQTEHVCNGSNVVETASAQTDDNLTETVVSDNRSPSENSVLDSQVADDEAYLAMCDSLADQQSTANDNAANLATDLAVEHAQSDAPIDEPCIQCGNAAGFSPRLHVSQYKHYPRIYRNGTIQVYDSETRGFIPTATRVGA